MMSMQNMFYGEAEPVWIMKPEKGDNNKKADDKSGAGASSKKEAAEYSILSTIPYYPYYYPDYVPSPAKKADPNSADMKETRVVMKVPVCCGECVESIEVALYQLKGVKSVECNTRRERVTVVATTAAPGDILMACRSVFRKSRMWTDDDY